MKGRALGRLPVLLLAASIQPFPVPVLAQEGPVLTMEAALERASQHNPRYRRALKDLELSEIERKQAWAAYLPTFSYSASTGVNLNRQLISTDNFGNPIENPLTDWKTSTASSQSLTARLVVWDWGARSRNSATQRAQARAREATVTSRLRTLRADVIRAYRSAQEQQALLAVEEGLLASRRADLERTRKMFDLVGATRVDVLTAELNVQQQQGRIEEAEGQLQRALLQLRTVVGDDSMECFEVTETLPMPFDPGGLEPQALAERAYSANPILIEQEMTLAVREAEAQSARRRTWPGITLNFNAGQGTYGDGWAGFADLFSDRSRYGGSSFGIQIPIFQGFDNKALIVQAEVSLANQQEILRETRLQVEEDVETRLISVQTAYQRYQIAVRSEEIAEERLILGRERFRLGTRTFSELQLDIDAAANAERDVITQLFSLERALVDLEEVVGEELR